LIFKYSWAELISRTPYLGHDGYRTSTLLLDKIEYDYRNAWVKTGTDCEFDSAKSKDYVIIDELFKVAPHWCDYARHPDMQRFE
jgi:hypothetical protein